MLPASTRLRSADDHLIDPPHLSRNTVPPTVHISAVVADHKEYPVDSAIDLPAAVEPVKETFSMRGCDTR